MFFLAQTIKRIQKSLRPPCLVVSVGNIGVGGTGKSVMTLFLLELFASKGVAVITRGYGRRNATTTRLVSNGQQLVATVEESGDEAYMLAALTSAVVVVSKNRALAWLAIKNNDEVFDRQTKVVILDDGYQNNNLVKDIEIVLVDAISPFGNGRYLPAGPLREHDLSRATMIVVTRADSMTEQKKRELEKNVRLYGGIAPLFYTRHSVTGVYQNNQADDVRNDLQSMQCLVLAGIGNFNAFVRQCIDLGCVTVLSLEYSDHYTYSREEVVSILATAKKLAVTGIVTTAKDWYKIAPFIVDRASTPFYVVHVGIEFLSMREYHDFSNRLNQALEGPVQLS